MSWKNGGGSTTEIAIFPGNANLDDFGWRVSTAEVSQDGPFSQFPDTDRTLIVLSGEGLVLDFEGEVSTTLTATSEPHSFEADRSCRAELIGGSATDFNVMTRRSHFRHAVRMLKITAPLPVQATDAGTLIFCRTGRLNIEGQELEAGDAALVESGSLTADPNGETEVILVEFAPA